jgi:PhoPQ-activated pathogenicity-related protein
VRTAFGFFGAMVLSLASIVCAEPPIGIMPTPLDRYVAEPDSTYQWAIENSSEENGMKTTVIRLRSQKWRTEKDIDRTVWEHWLIVTAPAKVTTNKAFLMIGGGGNEGAPPTKGDGMMLEIAKATNSMVIELKMIPNQPLVFHNDGVPRLLAHALSQGAAENIDATTGTERDNESELLGGIGLSACSRRLCRNAAQLE